LVGGTKCRPLILGLVVQSAASCRFSEISENEF